MRKDIFGIEKSMMEPFTNALWSALSSLLALARRIGVSGIIEEPLINLVSFLIQPPDVSMTVALPLDLKMKLPPKLHRSRTYAAGLYERDLTRLFLKLVRKGMVFVDVGAFVGYYSLMGSRLVGNSGKVYAFEPVAKNFQFLTENLRANNCSNVIPIKMAVSSNQSEVIISGDGDSDQFSVLQPEANLKGKIEATSLDDFFSRRGWRVDIIKLDIEGGEANALKGMMTLSKNNSSLVVIMEYNYAALRRSKSGPYEIQRALLSMGFKRGYIIERNLKMFRLADGMPITQALYNILFMK